MATEVSIKSRDFTDEKENTPDKSDTVRPYNKYTTEIDIMQLM